MKTLNINERIRVLRKTKDITQQQMADSLGMTVSSYNMKENGKRPIDTDELERIAGVLGVQTVIFFQEKFHVKWNGEISGEEVNAVG